MSSYDTGVLSLMQVVFSSMQVVFSSALLRAVSQRFKHVKTSLLNQKQGLSPILKTQKKRLKIVDLKWLFIGYRVRTSEVRLRCTSRS